MPVETALKHEMFPLLAAHAILQTNLLPRRREPVLLTAHERAEGLSS